MSAPTWEIPRDLGWSLLENCGGEGPQYGITPRWLPSKVAFFQVFSDLSHLLTNWTKFQSSGIFKTNNTFVCLYTSPVSSIWLVKKSGPHQHTKKSTLQNYHFSQENFSVPSGDNSNSRRSRPYLELRVICGLTSAYLFISLWGNRNNLGSEIKHYTWYSKCCLVPAVNEDSLESHRYCSSDPELLCDLVNQEAEVQTCVFLLLELDRLAKVLWHYFCQYWKPSIIPLFWMKKPPLTKAFYKLLPSQNIVTFSLWNHSSEENSFSALVSITNMEINKETLESQICWFRLYKSMIWK